MTASMTTQVVGGKEAILALRRIDPELRKQFTRDAKEVAKPATDAVKKAYQYVPLSSKGTKVSGLERNWTQKQRQIFPFSLTKARSGVTVKIDTRRNSENVILIQQNNVAAAVFESAGRKEPSSLAKNLGRVEPGRTRIIGPVVHSRKYLIEKEMQRLIVRVVALVDKKL
jgi:hypothetical protein